jgi:hypothetical protein
VVVGEARCDVTPGSIEWERALTLLVSFRRYYVASSAT